MSGRECQSCGSRMSPFIPRKRVGELLVCAGCAIKQSTILPQPYGRALAPPEAQVVTANAFEDSMRSAKTHAPYRIQESGDGYKVVNDLGETKGTHDTYDEARDHQKALYANVPGASEQAEKESSRRTAVEGPFWDTSDPRFSFANPDYRMGWEDGQRRVSDQTRLIEAADVEAYRAGYAVGVREKQGSRKVIAHDSGDGETIYHCPFCGAGQVVARSDGTAECGFCQTAFTVQVQPQRAAVPQTIDGVPHVHPDMPGSGREEPGVPEEEGEREPEPEEMDLEDDEENTPLFASRQPRYYLTDKGGVLDEDAYQRHLAILYAEDRAGVIAQVRAQVRAGRR